MVTLGFGGKTEIYAAERVIGHDPLRQFLVPRPGGRLQTLELSWDPKKKEWFDVYGNEDRKPGESETDACAAATPRAGGCAAQAHLRPVNTAMLNVWRARRGRPPRTTSTCCASKRSPASVPGGVGQP